MYTNTIHVPYPCTVLHVHVCQKDGIHLVLYMYIVKCINFVLTLSLDYLYVENVAGVYQQF